jgi:hypothetical protein
MAASRVSAVALLFALVAATSSTAGSSDASSPRLTRNVPGIVQLICKFGESDAPIPIVCPPLAPVTTRHQAPRP